MKKILLLVLAISLNICLFAQPPVDVKTGKIAANNGHLYGKIVDSTGKVISDVSVMALQSSVDAGTATSKEVLLKGTITKSNGEFDFEELPTMGKLKIQISATGYKALEKSISFLPEKRR